MLNEKTTHMGFDDSRRRRESGQWSLLGLNEKIDWRSEGILPPPSSSPHRSILSTLVSYSRRFITPSYSSPRYHRAGGSLTSSPTRESGWTLAVPSWSTIRFILLCSLWYMTSAMSSNTGKVILNGFRYPVTLTLVQFAFVAAYCAALSNPIYGMTTLRKPNRAILRSTIPMAAFQVGGHVFSSVAISRIPVSTVHTIKALSPMFTVAVYAFLFGVKYSPATYISLLPLTAGVMLACSFDVSAADYIGLISAFCSALVFVSSNIFFKKIMPSSTKSSQGGAASSGPSHKLDRINLLFYSSGIAFLFMIPIWFSSDFKALFALSTGPSSKITYYFFLNGTVHFAQNLIAFAVLASTSPVTYSIASLIKRIAVICIAVVWFAQRVHPIQAVGICMTFVGLWMYNGAKRDVERGEVLVRAAEAKMEGTSLPMTRGDVQGIKASPPMPQWVGGVEEAIGASSALTRPVQNAPVVVQQQPPHSHHHHQPPPPLNLNYIHKSKNSDLSPPLRDSYPSPPPSLDSPPRETQPTMTFGGEARNRRGTVTGIEGTGMGMGLGLGLGTMPEGVQVGGA